MNKWLWSGIAFIILSMVVVSVYVVNTAIDAGHDVAETYYEVGRTKTPLIEITDARHYFGTEHLIILFGKDEYEEEIVVWMSEDLSFLRHAWLKQGYNEKQIEEKVFATFGNLKKVHITPGVENDVFLWEAVYITESGEYLYVYFDFFSGDLLRSITLRKR